MLTPSRLIHKATCRIVCDDGASIGTGFLFLFKDPNKSGHGYPLLITNKHVVAGYSSAKIRFNVQSKSQPHMKFYDVEFINLSNQLVMHPEDNVDLCALPLIETFNNFEKEGINPDVFFFNEDNLTGIKDLTPIEDVFMVGYPNGLWDEVNNKPITRKGITASDINQCWNGSSEFMIDMACFGGSSGSPVFIMNEATFGFNVGSRLLLVGILYAGPQVNVNGTIDIINVPTNAVAVANSKVMMNLGIVIKSSKLLDFKAMLRIGS